MSDNNLKTQIEWMLWYNKVLSITQKDAANLYTNLVHANAFQNNKIEEVLTYVPNTMAIGESEDGELNTNFDSLKRANLLEAWNINSTTISQDFIEMFEEDNTLSEIVSQKMNSYNKGNIVGTLNKNNPIVKKATEAGANINDGEKKEAQDRISVIRDFVNASTDTLAASQNLILEKIEESMYYPYSGVAFIYHKSKELEDELATRWVEFTPFSFDSDITTKDIDKAEWAIITEKINYSEFIKRAKDGEYSAIKSTTKDDKLKDIWTRQANYQFAPKNFVEQAMLRTTALRSSSFFIMPQPGKATGVVNNNIKNTETENMFGIIDYMYQRTSEGNYILYTFLNGDLISTLGIDERIDRLPVVLFSENKNIRKNIDYKGNLAFKLLASQRSILKLNVLKDAPLGEAAPFINVNYTDTDQTIDQAYEVEQIDTIGNTITNITIFADNPVAANNSTKFLDGGSYFGGYLTMWDQQIMQIKNNMKEQAGITEFAMGTASHSIESQSGINQMSQAGLKNEYDVVKSHANAIKELMIMIGFTQLTPLFDDGLERAADGFKLSDAFDLVKHIFDVKFESAYNEEFTNSIIQTMIIPLAAQSGAIEKALPLLKALPVTEEFKGMVDKMTAEMEAAIKRQEEMAMQQQQQMQEQEQIQQSNEEADQRDSKNSVKTGKGGDSGRNEKKTQKTTSQKEKVDRQRKSEKKTEETKKASRTSKKPTKEEQTK